MSGKVIKGSGSGGEPSGADKVLRPPPRAGVINAEDFEARGTAKQIIAEAEAKAAQIIADAESKREQVYALAREDAKAEVFGKASEELARAKMQAGQIVKGAERDIVELACKVAAKIIGRDLEREPDVLMEICATAIENVRNAKAMVLRVNPKDGARLREKKPRLMELVGRTVDIAIRDDADIEAGGCLIQTEFGTVDAQLRTQYEMLQNLFVPDTGKTEGPK
jgi:type III secretion protein L